MIKEMNKTKTSSQSGYALGAIEIVSIYVYTTNRRNNGC